MIHQFDDVGQLVPVSAEQTTGLSAVHLDGLDLQFIMNII